MFQKDINNINVFIIFLLYYLGFVIVFVFIKKMLPIHAEINRKLDRFIISNKIPHILFHGSSGSSKLTLVKQFLAKIYRGDHAKMKSHVMIVNCSHGKGIQFIRDEIKFFAKANIQTKSCAEFKTIVLLNAHHLTADAQSALRRCIEQFSYNTRFFIVVENKNKLLTPILSRFCDVYVPEIVDAETGCIINMHQYGLDRAFSFRRSLREEKRQIVDRIMTDDKKTTNMDKSTEMYESGVSGLDLMDWIFIKSNAKSNDKSNDNRNICIDDDHLVCKQSELEVRFHTMKTEFRCEKLLLLFLLTEYEK